MPSSRRSTRREAPERGSNRGSARDSNTTQRGSSRSGSRSDIYSGNSAREESERVIEDAKRRQEEAGKNPFRFYLDVGDEKSFIILDDEPKFLRWEHEEWDARNKRMNHYGCVSATDNCPACDALEYKSYFAMYLTIIDLTRFKTKKTKETVEFSKKLLVVKQNQHKVFWRKFDSAGSLRGMLVNSYRDKKNEARIGGTLDFGEVLTEDELEDYISEYEDRDGNLKTEDVEPYDYMDLFPETTLESLEDVFGSGPAAGSSREARRELKDEYDDDPITDPEPGKGRVTRRGNTGSGEDRSSRGRDTSNRARSTEREDRTKRNSDDKDTDGDSSSRGSRAERTSKRSRR